MKHLLLMLFTFSVIGLFAQEKKQAVIKKTEKVIKSVKDGKESTETIIEESNTGDASMEELKSEFDKKQNGEFLTVEKEINNDVEKTIYTLTTKKDGKVSVVKWDGTGNMPEAIKNKMENIEVIEKSSGTEKNVTITIDNDKEDIPGQRKVMTWTGKNEEEDIEEESVNKVKLGILIDDEGDGVTVDEIFKDGVADKCGMKVGDIILKIEDNYIFSSDGLLKKLARQKKGEKVKVKVLREGKEVNLTAIL